MYTKFENTGSNKSREICDRNFHWRESKINKKGTDKQYVIVFGTQYNSSLSSFVPNFRILTQVVAERSLTEKNVHMFYIRVTKGKNEKLKKRRQNEEKHLKFHLHNTLCLPEGVHKFENTGSNRS